MISTLYSLSHLIFIATYEVGIILIIFLQKKNLKLREVKWFAQDHK